MTAPPARSGMHVSAFSGSTERIRRSASTASCQACVESRVSSEAREHLLDAASFPFLPDRFRLRLRLPLLRAQGDQFVDLAAVHIDDFERPAVVAKFFARFGQVLEHR